MVTVAGTVAFDGSLLESATVRPPAGAAADRVTANGVAAPNCAAMLAGRTIEPNCCTVTSAVVSAIFGAPVLAVIVVEPAATGVIGTLAVVAPAAIVTVDGTVALPVLLEARSNTRPPAGAAPERFSVRFLGAAPVIVRLDGVREICALTCTVPVSAV